MQQYETTIVLDSLLKAEDLQTTMDKFETFIKNNGGLILKKEDWGKKRLAYEINRKQYGNYYHIIFEGPGILPGLLEREYRLEESLLRYLTVIADSTLSEADEDSTQTEKPAAKDSSPEPQSKAIEKEEVVEEATQKPDAAENLGQDAEKVGSE